ncbi:ABC transporter substrate-binding protein [Aneurinibacillus sp. REN35]|uniref:ABC transporter substrate-binding protein n=1 Tax=Aneurinibacillus sp. REN35 TaxID=3237286 RepID=UPI0035277C84
MKVRKKAVGTWLAVLLLVGSTVGCGKTETEEAGKGAGSQQTQKVRVFLADSLLVSKSKAEEITKKFEDEHPAIDVQFETVPDGNLFERLRVMVATDEMPDIYQINTGHTSAALANKGGYLYDLKEMESMQNFSPAIQKAVQVDGKSAAFSLGIGVLGFHYNKELLAEVGFAQPPQTWEELMEAGEKLKQKDKALLVYASKWQTSIGNVFHWTFGHHALKNPEFRKAYESNSVDWSKPENHAILLEGYKRFAELNKYVLSGSFTNEYQVAQQAFVNGEAAMIMGGTWDGVQIRNMAPDLKTAFMNLPYAKEQENPVIFTAEDGLAINAKSQNLEAAKTFLNWLFSKEAYGQIVAAKQNFSAQPGVGELDEVYAQVPKWLETNRTVPFANIGPMPDTVYIKLGETAQSTTFGSDVEKAVEQFVKEYTTKKK